MAHNFLVVKELFCQLFKLDYFSGPKFGLNIF